MNLENQIQVIVEYRPDVSQWFLVSAYEHDKEIRHNYNVLPAECKICRLHVFIKRNGVKALLIQKLFPSTVRVRVNLVGRLLPKISDQPERFALDNFEVLG